MLTWHDIAEMSRHNMTFGAHTVTHPILTRLGLAHAIDEILISKRTIEAHLRSPVSLFAYPNGSPADFNHAIKQALKQAGFLCAATTIWGVNDIHTDPFELRRVHAWDSDARISLLRLAADRLWS
jgi:peptidoglycan/xylan/chitin deacetylase (PgdA/CDA1 family)